MLVLLKIILPILSLMVTIGLTIILSIVGRAARGLNGRHVDNPSGFVKVFGAIAGIVGAVLYVVGYGMTSFTGIRYVSESDVVIIAVNFLLELVQQVLCPVLMSIFLFTKFGKKSSVLPAIYLLVLSLNGTLNFFANIGNTPDVSTLFAWYIGGTVPTCLYFISGMVLLLTGNKKISRLPAQIALGIVLFTSPFSLLPVPQLALNSSFGARLYLGQVMTVSGRWLFYLVLFIYLCVGVKKPAMAEKVPGFPNIPEAMVPPIPVPNIPVPPMPQAPQQTAASAPTFCPHCGNPRTPGQAFCQYCGGRLN